MSRAAQLFNAPPVWQDQGADRPLRSHESGGEAGWEEAAVARGGFGRTAALVGARRLSMNNEIQILTISGSIRRNTVLSATPQMVSAGPTTASS